MTRGESAEPVEYVLLPPGVRRASRLAIPALVLSVLASPCVAGSIMAPIDESAFAPLYDMTGVRLRGHWFWIAGMGVSLALSLAVVIRTYRSAGPRTGKGMAVAALVISILDIVLAAVAALAVATMGFPAQH
jgi:hypothetical protein